MIKVGGGGLISIEFLRNRSGNFLCFEILLHKNLRVFIEYNVILDGGRVFPINIKWRGLILGWGSYFRSILPKNGVLILGVILGNRS